MNAEVAINTIRRELGYVGYGKLNYVAAVPLAVLTAAEFYYQGPPLGIAAGLMSLVALCGVGKIESESDVRKQEWIQQDIIDAVNLMKPQLKLVDYLEVLKRQREEILQMPELAAKPRKLYVLDEAIASTQGIIRDNQKYIDDVLKDT